MPIATPEPYAEMLNTAKAKGFAFPALNVSSSQPLNAVLLIIGGCILQAALIGTTIYELAKARRIVQKAS